MLFMISCLLIYLFPWMYSFAFLLNFFPYWFRFPIPLFFSSKNIAILLNNLSVDTKYILFLLHRMDDGYYFKKALSSLGTCPGNIIFCFSLLDQFLGKNHRHLKLTFILILCSFNFVFGFEKTKNITVRSWSLLLEPFIFLGRCPGNISG